MKLKLIAIILVFVMLTTTLCACSVTSAQQDELGNAVSSISNYPVSVYNTTFESAPTKIACLSDSIADILHSLNYDALLCAKASGLTSDYIKALPEVGTASDIDIDALTTLGVDLIISQDGISSKQLFDLQQKGIKSISMSKAKNFDELQATYTNLGSILGGAKDGYENAYKKSNEIFVTLENINKLVGNNKKQSACYMYNVNGSVITGDCLANDLMQLAGIENIAKNYKKGYMPLDKIVSANPKFIFCTKDLKNSILSNSKLKKTYAVKHSQVVEMDSALLNRQGSTLIEAITFIADTIYPNLVTKASDANKTPSKATNTQSSPSKPSQTKPDKKATDNKKNATTKKKVTTSKKNQKSNTKNAKKKALSAVIMKKGSKGAEVKKLQIRLKKLGFTYMKPNGIFDDDTVQAVKNYQFTSNFYATGKVTQQLYNEIYSDKAKRFNR